MMFSIKTIRIRVFLRLSFLSLFLFISACAAVGPDYSPPDTSAPDGWQTKLVGGLTARQIDDQTLAKWWTVLKDPILSRLAERAVAGNLSLKEARARVREARARRAISGADQFPTLDATGSASRSRSSEDTGGGRTLELYQLGFDASWEVDLFGGVHRAVEAAEADLQAAGEALRDVLVSLLAEVALNYIDVRSFQARLSIAESNLEAQEETCNIVQWRFQAGLTTQLDVEQATYNLEQTRSQLPPLRVGLEQAKNRLAVLLGERPGSLNSELEEPEPVPITPPEVAVSVPAEVLRRRPDVRKAERELAAQTARIGVATADLYPKFSLIGSIGLEALSTGKLLETDSRTYNIGPRFTWPIFDAGAITSNIEVQEAVQEQKLIQYEAAVLTALEDVENALASYTREQLRRQSLIMASQAARRAVEIAQDQYSAGLIDFQVVLEAQRSLFSLQDQLAQSESEVISNLIALYKALGGGWTSLASRPEK
jgi:NodT family efflux transporter outer membrane factor (OMF) lipoprotein